MAVTDRLKNYKLIKGTDRNFSLTGTGTDLAGATFYCYIKTSLDAPDSEALQKTSLNGGIVINSLTSTTFNLTLILNPEDFSDPPLALDNSQELQTLYYAFTLKDAGDEILPLSDGKFQVKLTAIVQTP